MDISIFKKLGLTDKESSVYIKLLENGAMSVRALASVCELNRGTTYDVLKRLQEVGLVSYYHHETKQKFVAENPEQLMRIAKNNEDDIRLTKEKIGDLIPELKALQEKEGDRPVAKFYEGLSGVKSILEDLLQEMKEEISKEYYVYSAVGVREDIYTAFPEYNQRRVKHGIKAKTISLSAGGGTYGLDERKWLNHDEVDSMTYIIIYAGKCAFIARDTIKNPVGVIVENEMIYYTQKNIFNNLWKLLK